ncbi:MAG: hypothetical protein RL722_1935, partial [Pseudomonadota bacterium]
MTTPTFDPHLAREIPLAHGQTVHLPPAISLGRVAVLMGGSSAEREI